MAGLLSVSDYFSPEYDECMTWVSLSFKSFHTDPLFSRQNVNVCLSDLVKFGKFRMKIKRLYVNSFSRHTNSYAIIKNKNESET